MANENASPEEMLAGAAGLMGNVTLGAPAAPPAGVVQQIRPIGGAAPASAAAPPAGTPPAAPVAAPNGPIIVDTPLGAQVYGQIPENEIVLTSFADVQAYVKDTLGMEIKEVKDLVPIFSKLKATQAEAQKVTELQNTVDTYKSTLNNLPPEVSIILGAALNGNDHMAVIQKLQQRSALDFDKPFEQQDPLRLINHYTGKQYSKESFDTLDETAKSALLDSVKLKFTSDSNELKDFTTKTQNANTEKRNLFLTSIENSIAQMVAANPNMSKEAVEHVRRTMLYGISDRLFTKEKTYAPDAAEKIAMMEFGKQTIANQAKTIGDIVAQMTNAGVSKATENILLRSDKPSAKGGTQDVNALSAIVEQETAFLKVK